MAIGKPRINIYLLIATVAQPILILIFHQSLSQIVWSNLLLEMALFIPLLWHVKKTLGIISTS